MFIQTARLGTRLLTSAVRDLLGPLWPLRRFVLICRTQNPVVARRMRLFNEHYPRYGTRLPHDVRAFAESLLPVLNAQGLDERCRLIGTLDDYAGNDFTDIWNHYYFRGRDDEYEKLIFESAFEQRGDQIINRGALVFMMGYAQPFRFIRYLFH